MKHKIFFAAGLLAIAASSAVVAQGVVTNRQDYVYAVQGYYDESRAWNHFQSLRDQCQNAYSDSVNNFYLGRRNSPVANINHTCNRYTTCDGTVNVPGGPRVRFVLRCR